MLPHLLGIRSSKRATRTVEQLPCPFHPHPFLQLDALLVMVAVVGIQVQSIQRMGASSRVTPRHDMEALVVRGILAILWHPAAGDQTAHWRGMGEE